MLPQVVPRSLARPALLAGEQRRLYGFLRFLLRDRDLAAELLQEVSVRVLALGDAPDDPDAFGRFCRGVARNVVLQHARTRSRARELPTDALAHVFDRAALEVEAPGDDEARRTALESCLQTIEPEARDLIWRRYAEGETSAAAAQRLSRTAEAVRQALVRIRRALLGCVDRRLRRGGNA